MKERKDKTKYTAGLLQLFWTFLKVGAFTFGGGYAMISILEEELVSKKKWVTSQDMLDLLVIAESTPGVIAVNAATSIGYKVHSVLGAIVATLGVVLPSFLIIFGLSFAIQAFQNNEWYKAAFSGIQACVTILIINAFVKVSKNIQKDAFSIVLLLSAFAVAVFTDFNVIFLIIFGGVLGIVYTLIKDAVSKKKQLPLENVEQDELGSATSCDGEKTETDSEQKEQEEVEE